MTRRPSRMLIVLAVLAMGIAIIPATASASGCDPAHVRVRGNDIRVLPTGGDDTENLQCALDLAASMPRGRVTLAASTYSTSFLDVVGFNGVFRGAGMDATRLQTLAEGLDCVTRVDETGFPHLIIFAGGDVTVRDLTIGVGGESACAEPWDEFIDEDGFGVLGLDVDALAFRPGIPVAGECLPEADMTATVDDVRFDGSSPSYEDQVVVFTHIFHGVIGGGFRICPETRTFGDVAVTDSEFLGPDIGVGLGLIDESSIHIARNRFEQVGIGVNSWSHSNTKVGIRKNTVVAKLWASISGSNPEFAREPHAVTIENNDVEGVLFADGIGVIDLAAAEFGRAYVDATITNNHVTLDSDFTGITLIDGSGVAVHRNSVDGSGAAAIGVFGGEGSRIVHNDVSGFAGGVAQIWLDGGSANTTVRCASPADTVLDEGTANVVRGCSLLDALEESAAPEMLASPSASPSLGVAETGSGWVSRSLAVKSRR